MNEAIELNLSNNQDDQALTHALANNNAGISEAPFPNAPPSFLIRMVLGLRRGLLKLADRVVPAEAAMFERCIGIGQTQILGTIARHQIPDILEEGPMTAEELAQRTGTNADAMHRMLRAAATAGIFALEKDGTFSNNRMSRALKSNQISRAKEFAEYFASRSNCMAYLDFDYILKTGKDGFEKANSLDLWQWFDEHPYERETFAQMMMAVTISETPMVAKLYPFEKVKKLCDVGGGRGALLSEIVIRYPHIQGVLFDCEGVIASSKSLLKQRGVADRVETVVGNFFEAVVPGCDTYLLKNVLHDWDDNRCINVLKNCRKVMQAGNRVLLVEIIVEKNDRTNFGAFRDMHVLTVCTGGRERSRDDYRRLLEASGFVMTEVYDSPIISVVEGVVA